MQFMLFAFFFLQIMVHVVDVNDHRPIFEEDQYSAKISESAPVGSRVLTVSARDEDEDQRVIYSIHSAQHRGSLSMFKIDSTRGIITTSMPLDR